MSTSPSSSTWSSLVSSVKTHLTTLRSQGEQLRTGKSDVYQQPIAGLSPKSSWVKQDLLVEGALCLFLSHTPITRPADYALAEDSFSEWEECKKSRAE